MEDYFVQLQHITKVFPGIIANDDISIDIKKGEIYALLGENGAGKSTLMSVLFGLYEPDEGKIFIKGKEVSISSPLKANQLNIGMVHQHFKLVSDQTIAENIILGAEPMKKKWGFIKSIDIERANKEVAALSKKYNFEVNPTDLIKDIPVSTRQRVEILKMLYRNAELLIFDEPTAVLAPQEIISLLEIIKSLRDSGKTIILITHKLDEIKQVADRCAILCKGKLIDILDVKKASTQLMANLMVGHELEVENEREKVNKGKVVLDVRNLCYKDKEGVNKIDDVSFKIHEGEVLSIAGVSGNGQVEIADAISNMIKATSGTIELNGNSIDKLNIRERAEAGLAYIPEDRQNVGLILDFPLYENLILKEYFKEPYCSKHGILNFNEFKKRSDRLIDKFDIRSSNGCDTTVRSMSGGNQQKAIIAREISLTSSLIIFVQPTRGLDVGAIENIHNKINELRKQGKAILLISLELDEVMALSDTILVLYSGKVQTIRDAKDLSKNQVGEYMMGVHNNA
jgi:simple sugar transport system ATP-binding protein